MRSSRMSATSSPRAAWKGAVSVTSVQRYPKRAATSAMHAPMSGSSSTTRRWGGARCDASSHRVTLLSHTLSTPICLGVRGGGYWAGAAGQRLVHCRGELRFAIRFVDQRPVDLELTAFGQCLRREPRGIDDRDVRALLPDLLGQCHPIHTAGHDYIREEEVQLRGARDDLQGRGPIDC